MRKILIGIACVGLLVSTVTYAQRPPRGPLQELKDPVSGLNQDQWIQAMKDGINGKSVVGRPLVFMINGSGHEIVQVLCKGYYLVGPKPYLGGPATTLPAWKVSVVETKGFDTYCKETGAIGTSDEGESYKGVIPGGNFNDAAYVTFKNPQ